MISILLGIALLLFIFIGAPILALVWNLVFKWKLRWYLRILLASFPLIGWGLIQLDKQHVAYTLNQVCLAEGGLQIYGRRDNVRGVLGLGVSDEKNFTQSPFEFHEYDGFATRQHKKYHQIRKQSDGSVIRTQSDTPQAEIKIDYQKRRGHFDTYDLQWADSLVIEIETGRVLARYRRFEGAGGVASKLTGFFFGQKGGYGEVACPGKPMWSGELLPLVVSPVQQQPIRP